MDKNKYGCRKEHHEKFRLQDKIYCGECNSKMYPVSAISHNGNPLKYYNCSTTKKNNCATGCIHKNFIEGIIDKFLIAQFNTPKNLETLVNNIFEVHKKRVKVNSSLTTIKSDLQKTNQAITNIMSAIEKGILTDTTKSRLVELENLKKELEQKLIIEESKERFELTKESIQNFFKYTMKECPNRAIELFIKTIKVYKDKIEIAINYSLNQPTNKEPLIKKLFTETYTKQVKCKANSTRTITKTYDVYVVI